MLIALVTARLVLFPVFAVAGIAKLLDRKGSREGLIGFGVPAAVAGPLGTLLPIGEIVTAALLLPAATAWLGAVAALALLLAFVVGIGLNLAFGRTPDCHCFGQLHSAPVGWPTLLRNAALALLAALLVWPGGSGPPPSLFGWLVELSVPQRCLAGAGLALVILVLIQTALLYQVLRQQGRMLLRLEALGAAKAMPGEPAPAIGLPPDSPAPGFALPDLRGRIVN